MRLIHWFCMNETQMLTKMMMHVRQKNHLTGGKLRSDHFFVMSHMFCSFIATFVLIQQLN